MKTRTLSIYGAVIALIFAGFLTALVIVPRVYNTPTHLIYFGMLACVAYAFYFAPTVVAFTRDRKSTLKIALLNLLLGWSGVAWGAAMAWAFIGAPKSAERAAAPR